MYPTQITPPDGYALVEEGIHRSLSSIFNSNFHFLNSLDIKTAIYISTDPLPKTTAAFIHENQIELINPLDSLGPDRKENWSLTDLGEEIIKEGLEILLSKEYHPVLLLESSDNVESVLVGCLRRMQDWCLSSVFEEYRARAGPAGVYDEGEQLLERFDPGLARPPPPPRAPRWFAAHRALLEQENQAMKELGWLGLYSNTKGGSLGSCGEKGASYKSAGALTMSDYMDVMQRFSALCCSDGENDDGHLEGIVNMLFFTKLELEESLPEEDQQQHSRPDALSVANKPYLTQDGETFPDKDCSASALVDGSGIEHTAREGENLAAEDKNSSSHDTKVSLPTALGAAAVEQIDEPLDSLPPVYGARLPMASYWGPLVSPGCVFSEKLSILDEDDDG